MRTVRRLRLRCFSFNIFSDELSTYRLVTLSNLGQAHHKIYCNIPYGGPGGIRTPVQNPFKLASHNYNYLTASVCLCLTDFFRILNHNFLTLIKLWLNSALFNLKINFLTFIFNSSYYI